jgi:hypothetical protein
MIKVDEMKSAKWGLTILGQYYQVLKKTEDDLEMGDQPKFSSINMLKVQIAFWISVSLTPSSKS